MTSGDPFSGSSNAAPQNAHQQRLGLAAAEDLRRTVRTGLNELFGKFVTRLPDELNAEARKAAAPANRRALEELARSVPVIRQGWIDTFARQVDAHLVGGFTAGKDSPRSAGGDDVIALANVEIRAEGLHRQLILELDMRLERIRQTIYLQLYSKALAPAALCRALQETADALHWPAAQRRFLFERFDANVVPQLEQLYKSMIAELARIGKVAEQAAEGKAAEPAQPASTASWQAESAPTSFGVMPPLPEVPSPKVVPLRVDANTRTMLESYAVNAAEDGYNDGSLAVDLLALEDTNKKAPVEGVKDDARWVPLQRMSLAGNFLNDSISDPFVSAEMRPQHESMRFPLVKSALTDSTLFTAVTHPLRSLVNELMLKSATSRITGSAEARRMAELLQQVLVQFDLAPDFVREAMLTATPIDESQITRFFEMQKQQALERRDIVVKEAKRLVVRELELRTFGRAIPAPAIKFLNTAWGPLLVKRLLQYGAAHDQWKAGVAQMEQLLDVLEARQPTSPPPPQWREMLSVMSRDLGAAGLSAAQLQAAMASLETAWKTGGTEGAVA